MMVVKGCLLLLVIILLHVCWRAWTDTHAMHHNHHNHHNHHKAKTGCALTFFAQLTVFRG